MEKDEIPRRLERYVDKPYGGLFGNSVEVKVVEEIVADPYIEYRPKDLEDIIGASAPSIRRALSNLTALGLLIKDSSDAQHPVYRVNLESKKITALTFLAYAVVDDRDGLNCMDKAISNYYMNEFWPKIVATADTRYPDFGGSIINWRTEMEIISVRKNGASEDFTVAMEGV
ncbi:MAG: hypothetical protein IBX41_01245 [Methanophagales archaeon]|nr:hypothetical protein [Methanophagales archaeon]